MTPVLNKVLLTVQATMLAPCTALNTFLALATIKITVQALSQALLLALVTIKITVLALLEVRHILPVLTAVQAQRKHHMGVSEHLTNRVVHSKVYVLLYIKPPH